LTSWIVPLRPTITIASGAASSSPRKRSSIACWSRKRRSCVTSFLLTAMNDVAPGVSTRRMLTST
jgi:hypothetical protein